MRQMFSGSFSVIDYQSRYEFLHATTKVMKPAPIDSLVELLPVFRSWFAHFDDDEETHEYAPEARKIGAALRRMGPILSCAIPDEDTSAEAAALKLSVSEWMTRHRFDSRDQWIAEAAFCTLFEHARHRAEPRGWYLREPHNELRPDTNVIVPWKGGESHEEHLLRLDTEYQKVRKEFLKRISLHLATRKGEQSALWTAIRFTVPTVAQVARSVGREEDAVRKAITAFAHRTRLTLPTLEKMVHVPIV